MNENNDEVEELARFLSTILDYGEFNYDKCSQGVRDEFNHQAKQILNAGYSKREK